MHVLWASNARIIVCDVGVVPFSAENMAGSRVPRVGKSRYLGPRGRKTKEAELKGEPELKREERKKRVWLVVISLVKRASSVSF